MTNTAPKQEPPYGLRMPPDLKARVKAAAEMNNRSMNAEIVATLEEKYPVEHVRLDMLELFLEGYEAKRARALSKNDHAEAERLGLVIQSIQRDIVDFHRSQGPDSWLNQADGYGDGFGDGNGDGYGDGAYGNGNGDGMGGSADGGVVDSDRAPPPKNPSDG